MNSGKHLHSLSKSPCVAQSGLAIKLTATTAIIDRLLLAQQQSPWKIFDQGDIGTGGGGGDGGTGGIGGGGGGGDGEV
jgi:hypothetical protein